MKYVLLFVACFFCQIPQLTNADDKIIVAVSQLPAEVRNAADRAFADVPWLIAKRDDKGWYALGGLNAQKKFVEFRCDSQGNNAYFRIQIKQEELPAAVASVVQAEIPGATITRVQSAGLADGKVTVYRLEARNLPDGFNCFYVSASGQRHQLAND